MSASIFFQSPLLRKSLNFSLLFICLFFLTGCGSKRTIVNALDEKEANEIIVFLAGKGIDANKIANTEAGGTGASKMILWDIQVDSERGTESMALLNQAGLPRRRSQSLLNIFAGGGLVPSELQEKIRYQAGLAEQIASTIRKIDGVLDAEVQVSFPEEDPLNPGKKKGSITASVYVKHSGVLDDPNSLLIPKIKRLVAASVTGLDYDNVTVIADRARYSATTPAFTFGEEEKPLVNIWSIILAQESVLRFRIIFFSFVIAILFLILCLFWLSWKIAPLLKQHGGFRQLFHIHPIPIETPSTTAENAPSTTEKESTAKQTSAEDAQVDQEIDEENR